MHVSSKLFTLWESVRRLEAQSQRGRAGVGTTRREVHFNGPWPWESPVEERGGSALYLCQRAHGAKVMP